jgi:hypothetical protein
VPFPTLLLLACVCCLMLLLLLLLELGLLAVVSTWVTPVS